MRVLIIEDELPAARRMKDLVMKACPGCEILAVLDSVDSTIKWLSTFPSPDLMLMDIHLADGMSFDIFENKSVDCPIIFTTAYDQYMLKAFKVNSIDYLLKPVALEDLQNAIEKYERLFASNSSQPSDLDKLASFISTMMPSKTYKKGFLVKQGGGLLHVSVEEVAYFFSEDGISFLITHSNKKFALESTIEHISDQLDPELFYRINRSQIINLKAIQKIEKYFNQRLKLKLNPDRGLDHIVSRERVKDFKDWLNR